MKPERRRCGVRLAALLFWGLGSWSVLADSRNLAPGFSSLPIGATILVNAPDVELFAVSGGGVLEPRADWTATAQANLRQALEKKSALLRLKTVTLSEKDSDDLAEIANLNAAVSRSIVIHHMAAGFALPTKAGKLDWSMGDAVQPMRQASGADYALFIWLRDSYATAERKVAIVAFALLGVGIGGGAQVGHASLVDLRTGQVLWFNRLLRGSGDLRDADSATESLNALLRDFPETK